MDLLLILYAMIAGLTGFNAGPSAIARVPELAQGQVIVEARAPQAAVAVRALARRVAAVVVRPAAVIADARRIVAAIPPVALPPSGRSAPERRLE